MPHKTPDRADVKSQLYGIILSSLHQHNIVLPLNSDLEKAVDQMVNKISTKLPPDIKLQNPLETTTADQILKHIEDVAIIEITTTRFQRLLKWLKK